MPCGRLFRPLSLVVPLRRRPFLPIAIQPAPAAAASTSLTRTHARVSRIEVKLESVCAAEDYVISSQLPADGSVQWRWWVGDVVDDLCQVACEPECR
jgi:hypothetical protein